MMRLSPSRAVGLFCLLVLLVVPRSAVAQTFFEHINFEGASFSAGSDMNFVGWDWNDRASSLSIPPGVTVTLYQHIDFGGASLTVSGDNVDLRAFPGPGADGTWNDEVSSFRVNGGGGPSPSPTATTILVNGSFRSTPPWTEPGSPMFNAVAATFGTTPVRWLWRNDLNGFAGILFPSYAGITQGAYELAAFIDSLPAGDVNVVAHSHGGNVVGLATWVANRRLKHVINLATPINYDLQYAREMAPPPWHPYSRCQASSFVDAVQFIGASPFQVGAFVRASYLAEQYVDAAIDEFQAGNEGLALAEAAFAAYYGAVALDWWYSTKIEWYGPTYMWWTKWHSAMHEPDVWAELAPRCAVN